MNIAGLLPPALPHPSLRSPLGCPKTYDAVWSHSSLHPSLLTVCCPKTVEAPPVVIEYVLPAPVEFVAPAPAVTYVARAPVVECVAPATAVIYTTPVPASCGIRGISGHYDDTRNSFYQVDGSGSVLIFNGVAQDVRR